MSSSLGSMLWFHFIEDELAKGRVDTRVHRKHPMVFAREAQAFYRILLGHDDRIGVAEFEVRGGVGMMIGKRVRGKAQAQLLQMIEKTRRIADAGDGMHPLSMEVARVSLKMWVEQVAKLRAFERHRESRPSNRGRGPVTRHDDCIHAGEASSALPQRSGGQRKPVADAAAGIEHGDFAIPPQGVVLQTVVAHDDVACRICSAQRARGGDAVATDPDRASAALRQQDRLITRCLGGGGRGNGHGAAVPAIAPADHARRETLLAQKVAHP
jgi:hypothetical protein